MRRVEAALSGDEEAACAIRKPETTKKLEQILVGRGATPTEAVDIVADVWSDCFDSHGGRRPLLAQYHGKGNLEAFLSRVALNRLIDFKRRQRFRGQLPGKYGRADVRGGGDPFDQLPGESGVTPGEDRLIDLLRQALLTSFSHCDPEELLILKLVGFAGVGQERVARIWGWSQSKVSRNLSATIESVRAETLRHVRRADPWLELEWDDFINLCKNSSDFFEMDTTDRDSSA